MTNGDINSGILGLWFALCCLMFVLLDKGMKGQVFLLKWLVSVVYNVKTLLGHSTWFMADLQSKKEVLPICTHSLCAQKKQPHDSDCMNQVGTPQPVSTVSESVYISVCLGLMVSQSVYPDIMKPPVLVWFTRMHTHTRWEWMWNLVTAYGSPSNHTLMKPSGFIINLIWLIGIQVFVHC